MNLVVFSEISIYHELKTICDNENIIMQKVIALDVCPLKYNAEIVKSLPKGRINIIFQSKNSIKYSNDIHKDIKEDEIKVYCLGKYSSRIIKDVLLLEANYPQENYSSEDLFKIMIPEMSEAENILIIKGKDGRRYLEKSFKELGHNVEVINVYERRPRKLENLEKYMRPGMNNYFLISSKCALSSVLKCLNEIEGKYQNTLIIPNKRVVENMSIDKFDEIIVMVKKGQTF